MPNMLINPASRQLAALDRCPTTRRQCFDNKECFPTQSYQECFPTHSLIKSVQHIILSTVFPNT